MHAHAQVPDHSSGSLGLRVVAESAILPLTRQLMRTGFRAHRRSQTPLERGRNAITITLYLSQVLVARQTLRLPAIRIEAQ